MRSGNAKFEIGDGKIGAQAWADGVYIWAAGAGEWVNYGQLPGGVDPSTVGCAVGAAWMKQRLKELLLQLVAYEVSRLERF